ncbi:unnamed protein product [Cylicocyclus nassatus]|uniref:K Homology domain-containing protein n=1 Tax=Cylicocyclus nassatus TaxID=53992 RepID=A0AA36GFX4_CYLNA|nr:unnamed protein product [Cylicocyclus nassatus]
MLGWDELLKDRKDSSLLEPLKRTYITKLIKIPRKSIGTLVGRAGSTVHRIELETKTFIRVMYDKEKRDISESAEEISAKEISGEDWLALEQRKELEEIPVEIRAEKEEQISLASLAIRGLVADSLEPKITRLIFVEQHALGTVLGTEGRNIKRIQRCFRVRIQIDNEDIDLPCLSITGTRDLVDYAEHRIDQLINRGCNDKIKSAAVQDDFCLGKVVREMKELNKMEKQW